jgi:hypothetical protein
MLQSPAPYQSVPRPALLSVSEPKRRAKWPTTQQGFWDAVEPVLSRDGASERLGREIRRRQQALGRRVGQDAWREYVALEEVTSRRSLRWIEVVARWAHSEGLRRRPLR